MPETIVLSPRKILLVLVSIDLMFLLLHGVTRLADWKLPAESPLRSFLRVFSMGGEPTIPTWFAIVQLMALSALLIVVGIRVRARGGRFLPWGLLAALATYVSIDEQVKIHETLVDPMRELFGITSGPFLLAWVIPALALVGIVGVVFLPFFLRLPVATRWRFTLAVVVFVSGAVGMEMIDAGTFEYLKQFGIWEMRIKSMMYGLEELLELLGVSLAIWAVLRHLADNLERPVAPLFVLARTD